MKVENRSHYQVFTRSDKHGSLSIAGTQKHARIVARGDFIPVVTKVLGGTGDSNGGYPQWYSESAYELMEIIRLSGE